MSQPPAAAAVLAVFPAALRRAARNRGGFRRRIATGDKMGEIFFSHLTEACALEMRLLIRVQPPTAAKRRGRRDYG